MKISIIAFYTFLRNVRDLKSMVAFILLPLALVLILGTATDVDFKPKTMDLIKVGFLSEDEGTLGITTKQFLSSEEFSSLLEVELVADVDQGMAGVKSGELNSFIHVPADVSEELAQGNETHIEFYNKEGASFIGTALEGFIRSLNLDNALLRINGQSLKTNMMSSNIHEVQIVTEGKIPRGIDYMSITTLFQSLLWGALFGSLVITRDMGNHTYSRVLATPSGSSQILLGKLIGSTMTLYAIALFIFLVTKYAFGANWNASLWVILLVLLLFCLISIAIGMSLAYLTQSTMISALVIFILSTIWTLVSGGFSPIDGETIEMLSRFSPNTYAQNALFANIYEGSIDHNALLGLVLCTGILIVLTFISARRKIV